MKQKTLRILKTTVLFGACISLFSCVATPPTPTVPTYVPKFDFTPSSQVEIGSAGITFGMVSPRYSEEKSWAHQWPFDKFSENMALDFQELLSARGFTARGPFRSYQDMTFPDKKGTDLILEPLLQVNVDVRDVKYDQNFGQRIADRYTLVGNVTLSGRVTLSVEESLSKERMWFKSIELSPKTIPWVGTKEYSMAKDPQSGQMYIPKITEDRLDYSDPGFTQAIGKPIEDFYIDVLQNAWKYLDPEEMRLVNKQAEEIRKKKVY